MPVRLAYRFSDVEHQIGEEITSAGDHYDNLTPSQKQVETSLRGVSDQAHATRVNSLYTWEDEDFVERIRSHDRRKFLYTVSIEEADIAHIGDVNHYTAAELALERKEDLAPHVNGYWSGRDAAGFTSPRREVLASKATVVGRVER